MEIRFVADTMLGRLAKWLRALGYDTRYQTYYGPGIMDEFIRAGAILLSRHRKRVHRYPHAVFLHGNTVEEQIIELKEKMDLDPERSGWFSRCLLCNTKLAVIQLDEIRENVPEYVFHQNISDIKRCPSCGRYYWPGSHKANMEIQLRKWGFKN